MISLTLLQLRTLTYLRLKLSATFRPEPVLPSQVASYLGLSNQHAKICLEHLANAGLAESIDRGTWILTEGGQAYDL